MIVAVDQYRQWVGARRAVVIQAADIDPEGAGEINTAMHAQHERPPFAHNFSAIKMSFLTPVFFNSFTVAR